jgi:two-component system, sporulation sensor kinase A
MIHTALDGSIPTIAVEILERMTDGFFALDHDWRFTYVNTEASRLLFRDRNELLGKNVWDEFPDAVTTDFYQQYRRAMARQRTASFQEYFEPLHKWFDVCAYPSNNGLSVYFRDVTEEKRRTSTKEQHYRSLFEENPDLVYSFDLNGKYTSINSAFHEVMGYSHEELIGKHFRSLIHEDDLERVMNHFEYATRGHTQQYEVKVYDNDGQVIGLDVTSLPIIVDGQITGVYGIAKDLRNKREMEREIWRSQSNLALSQSLAHIGSWEYYFDKEVEWWSRELFNVYGIEDMGTISYSIISEYVHPEDREQHMKANTCVLRGEPIDLVYRIIRPDGQVRTIHAKSAEFIDEVGQRRVIGTSQDITEHRITQEALLRAEKLSAVGQLAAGIAHEIRNPLTALKGFLKLIPVQEGKKYIHEIMEGELNRIEAVTNEMLVLAKPQRIEHRLFDIGQIIKSVIHLLESQSVMKSLVLTLDCDEEIQVVGESNRLEQVMFNVIKNATEACPISGEIQVECKVNGTEAVTIRVTDNGKGIPEQIIQRIGEPFFTTKDEGTGLGLMVSQKIISDHKGTFDIESEEGKGTTVTIVLPCHT